MAKPKIFKDLASRGVTAQKNKKTVLIVEDDRSHRTMMTRILQESGFDTVPAENGIVALSKINSEQHFDLVIMDWDLPALDGLATTRAIRAREVNENKDHIPVIAFTSHREAGDREKCLAAGMDAYLPKSVWMPEWRQVLTKNLEGLLSGNFDPKKFDRPTAEKNNPKEAFDLNEFDEDIFNQCAALLKDEMEIAIEEYLEDAAAYIRDIQRGLEEGGAEKVARGSHPLKSNSRGFGLIAVSKLAEIINQRANTGNLDGVEFVLTQLQKSFSSAEKRMIKALKHAGY